jgi:mRNA interferase MazF
MVGRGEVFLVSLDPTQGREIKKTRPCLIVSPDEMNRNLGTVIVPTLARVLGVLGKMFAP